MREKPDMETRLAAEPVEITLAVTPALEAPDDPWQALERQLDQLVGLFGHELRTPLHHIVGFASILEDELEGPLTAGQRRSVDRITQGARRMGVLVEELLAFAERWRR